MKHFYREIPGMMDYEDLYIKMVNKFPNGSKFAEIGVWKGRSAAFMATEIFNSGKYIKFHIVDNFLKSDLNDVREKLNIFRRFVNIYKSDSAMGASIFKDEYFNFVFIDADHLGPGITKDINAWLPKVKRGGVLAGHDYENPRYPELKTAVDKSLKVEKKSKMCWYYEKA